MKKKTTRTISVFMVLTAILLVAGCSKKEPAEEQPTASSPAAATPAAPIDPATAATVTGTVKFEGAAAKPAKIDMSQDANCKGSNTAENVVVAGSNLANVFVYVKEGLGNRTFAAPSEPVVLDQSGCRYHPHVLGVMAGQSVKIVAIQPHTTFTPRQRTIANGMSRRLLRLRPWRKASRARKSCCP